jgi:hypothetical protein
MAALALFEGMYFTLVFLRGCPHFLGQGANFTIYITCVSCSLLCHLVLGKSLTGIWRLHQSCLAMNKLYVDVQVSV